MLSTVKDAEYATAFVLGMQVKSGTSYALAEGGRIPVREHGHYWRTSTLPIFVCTVVDSDIFVEDAFTVLSIEPNATLIRLFAIEGVGVRRRVAGRMSVEVPQGWEF